MVRKSMKRFSVSLPSPLDKEVKEMMDKHGYTAAEIVREGVRMFIQKKREVPA